MSSDPSCHAHSGRVIKFIDLYRIIALASVQNCSILALKLEKIQFYSISMPPIGKDILRSYGQIARQTLHKPNILTLLS